MATFDDVLKDHPGVVDRGPLRCPCCGTQGDPRLSENWRQTSALRFEDVELSEALASDLILLAIPLLAVASFGRSGRDWSGKTIVDVTNAFLLPNADEVLAGRLSTEIVADAFPGAETVNL